MAINVYISYKFGRLISSTSVVNAAQLCTVGIHDPSALGLVHLRSLRVSTFVCRYYSLGGDTAMPGGYTLGFATHF